MTPKTRQLRELLASGEFLYMPSAATPLEGKLAEAVGTPLVYTGGYVSGASRAITEPLLTMDEQVRIAGEVARAVSVPLIADAGAGFGEPLHTMRTVREFANAGVAGVHIEDQLYPKRAHYHTYLVHAIPLPDFVDKIKWACRQRDDTDRDFVIIARSDTAREFGVEEAVDRVNAAAEVGADMGLVFPRDRAEAEIAPKRAKVPLVWVQSRGNRDGRPILSLGELSSMGYRACIDAQLSLGVAVHSIKQAFAEMMGTGSYTGISDAQFTAIRKEIEDLIGLESFYRVEAETVEKGS
ncbi:MAG: isocitrate lyase/PEP mutase family protein [Alphaproteobacteria bacterium]|nr:isocitrate lyase/PEP mutase family protein [Alphaproteobacteria bacterium]